MDQPDEDSLPDRSLRWRVSWGLLLSLGTALSPILFFLFDGVLHLRLIYSGSRGETAVTVLALLAIVGVPVGTGVSAWNLARLGFWKLKALAVVSIVTWLLVWPLCALWCFMLLFFIGFDGWAPR
jgi:hypothetical protein